MEKKILTEMEELELFSNIEKGKEALIQITRECEGYSLHKEEIEKMKKSRERIIEANFGLVGYVAKKYVGNGLEFDDLFQSGLMGLLIAIDRFDSKAGVRFSTYAYPWIMQSIVRSIKETGKAIRLPCYIYDQIHRFNQKVKELTKDDYIPTNKELSLALGIKEEEISNLLSYKEAILSLDNKIFNDNDTTLLDTIEDEANTPIDIWLKNELKKTLHLAMKEVLNETEYFILSNYYGIEGEALSLSKISILLHLSKERVRQISIMAREKLKNSKYKEDLEYFCTFINK